MKKIIFLLLFPFAALAQAVTDGTISTNITNLSNMSSTYTNEKPKITNILSELLLSKPNILINPGYLYVGNGSGIATGVALSGDATLSQSGGLSVIGIRGVSVSSTAPTSNQVLQYNGSTWIPSTLSLTTTLSGLTDANISSPANGQFLQYQTSDSKWHNHALVSGDIPTLNQNTTGSAATLTNTRNLAATGDAAWNVNFNGSADVTAALTLATVNSNVGSFGSATQSPSFTVNGKGLITAASNITITPAITSVTGLGSGWLSPLQASLGSGWAAALNTTYSSGAGNYQTIQNAGSSLTQRATLNVSTGLTAVDNSGSSRTDITNNLVTGISGGGTATGGINASENLNLSSTSHSTKGAIIPDSYLKANYTGSTQSNFNLFQMKTFGSGNTFNGGGYIVVNAFGSGYTTGSYNNVTFTYTSGTFASNVVLTGITIAGGVATNPPYFYWLSGGTGADATTRWTASGIPGGSGFTVKLATTDYRSTQGDFFRGITQSTTNGDNQVDAIEFEGYNYNGGGKVNANEMAFGRNLESHFLQGGNFGQVELYYQGFYRDGSSSRPFGMYIDKQNGGGIINFQVDSYNFFTSPSAGNLLFFTLGGGTGVATLSGSSSRFDILNTASNAGAMRLSSEADGHIAISNQSTTAFPGNYLYLGGAPVYVGSASGSVEDSPNELFRINGNSSSSNFAVMSINTIAASKSAAVAFTQGSGDGTSGNRNIAIGLDGNATDNYWGLGGSSNNLLFRFWNGSAFQTAMTVNTGNGNVELQNLGLQTASIATAAGTTTLTSASKGIQIFTGSTTQTVALPVVTTLRNGFMFRVVNLSSGVVTVQTSGSNTVKALAANSYIDLWVLDTTAGTGTASWNWYYNTGLNN